MKIMQENIKEGGAPVFTKYSVTVGDALWTNLYSNIDSEKYSIDGVFEDGNQKFAVLQNREDNTFSRMNFSFDNDEFSCGEIEAVSEYAKSEEPQFNPEDVKAFESEFKKKKDNPFEKKDEDKKDDEKEDESDDKSNDKKEDKSDDGKKKNPFEKKDDKSDDEKDDSEDDSEDDKKKKKKKFNLEEIEEYVTLKAQYAALEETNKELLSKVEELTQFKNSVDRVAKEDLINNQFFMLDAEDKKDVIENIDTYSLDDIEAKLAVIAVRKKVNFSLEEPESKDGATTFNLDSVDNDDLVPAWIRAVKATAKSMNE